jgi:hypothetical protein
MAAIDLASLNDVKAWLNISNTNSDVMLAKLITSTSLTILGALNRNIVPGPRTETLDGLGGRRVVLSDWPVLAVSGLQVDGAAISASTSLPFGAGYVLDAQSGPPPGRMQSLSMVGGCFSRAMSNVTVSYTAGYQITAEGQIVPAGGGAVTVAAPYGDWASDQGVTYAAGQAMTRVASNPAAGQYAVAAGVYTFALGDAGQGVLISYGYVPADLRQACIEACADEFKAKDRIGVQSKSLAGQETVTYTSTMLTKRVMAMIAPYMRVVQP